MSKYSLKSWEDRRKKEHFNRSYLNQDTKNKLLTLMISQWLLKKSVLFRISQNLNCQHWMYNVYRKNDWSR